MLCHFSTLPIGESMIMILSSCFLVLARLLYLSIFDIIRVSSNPQFFAFLMSLLLCRYFVLQLLFTQDILASDLSLLFQQITNLMWYSMHLHFSLIVGRPYITCTYFIHMVVLLLTLWGVGVKSWQTSVKLQSSPKTNFVILKYKSADVSRFDIKRLVKHFKFFG